MKIVHGLGMTAEELYYGEPSHIEYSDLRQQQLNGCYEVLNEEPKETIVGVAASFATDSERRAIKDTQWIETDLE